MATKNSASPVEKKLSKDEIQTLISTLPREGRWFSSNNKFLYQYQGFWYPLFALENILSGLRLPSSSNLTLICSAPKSGTTWLKALAFAITSRKSYLNLKDSPLLTSFPHYLVPFIEFPQSEAVYEAKDDVNLSLLSTHMSYSSLPRSILDYDPKIIYIWRDPKDVFISLWHFSHKLMPKDEIAEPISLDQALDLFCRGVSHFGSYWDHVLGYWNASVDHHDKVLFLKYEDMMSDPVLCVNHLADFMGYSFSNEEVMDGVDVKIVKTCSFESLSNLNMGMKTTAQISRKEGVHNGDSFFRKGEVGDWRNFLTQEMATRIDQITLEKLSPIGLKL